MSEYENRSQQVCAEVGLNCESCASVTAHELAKSCRGLRGKMVAQLFVQLYPAPECARMHARFSAEYKAASRGPERGDDWEDIPTVASAREVARPPRVAVA
jgi:hypothetical protein